MPLFAIEEVLVVSTVELFHIVTNFQPQMRQSGVKIESIGRLSERLVLYATFYP